MSRPSASSKTRPPPPLKDDSPTLGVAIGPPLLLSCAVLRETKTHIGGGVSVGVKIRFNQNPNSYIQGVESVRGLRLG